MEVLGPEAFDGSTLRRPGTWVVDFSADWCPFCRDFLALFSSLDGESTFGLAIGDLNDVASPLWDQFRLEVTPTVIAFRDGVPFFRRDGRRGEGLDAADMRALRVALGAPPSGRGAGTNPRP